MLFVNVDAGLILAGSGDLGSSFLGGDKRRRLVLEPPRQNDHGGDGAVEGRVDTRLGRRGRARGAPRVDISLARWRTLVMGSENFRPAPRS